jgi:cation diffusion facilitator CzcD-associated flavoprotein CzcO
MNADETPTSTTIEDSSSRTPLRIAIVGAGFGGIALAVKLRTSGFDDFLVFEQSAGPGGTWYDNTYPGAQVDVPSHLYSFSFMPYDWSRRYGKQPELQQYAEDTIDHFDIRRNFKFSTRVNEAVWDETSQGYIVRTDNDQYWASILVSCVGFLNVPNPIHLPGSENFQGPVFHSARWNHNVDIDNKKIAVVGTGSTACQMVPELHKRADQIYLFQREPGWVAPKPDEQFTPQQRRRNMRPINRKLSRWYAFWKHVETLGDRNVGSRRHRRLTRRCLELIDSSIDDPSLKELVTPTYPLGCKRLVQDSNYYAALNASNVELIPRAVAGLTDDGIIDACGDERTVDMVVMAVGFRAADYLASLPVIGPNGVALREAWSGEPQAYLGVTVPGYPNFFMLYGPNTNGGGSIVAQHERQAELVVRIAKRMRRHGFTRVDTKLRAMQKFIRWVDRKNAKAFSAIHEDCHNYFRSRSGRNATQWPLGQVSYMWRTKIQAPRGLVMSRPDRAGERNDIVTKVRARS